jgi:hypothetical protein
MRKLLLILLSVISVSAYSQSQPTSSKTRFVNGLYMGTKLDSYFNTADSNAIYWRADSVVMAKYKGTARALAFDVAGGYVPYTGATQNVTIGNFRVSARTLLGDSIMARTSAGVSVYGNSGTQVALFGAGGGSGTTLYGRAWINGDIESFNGSIGFGNSNRLRIARVDSAGVGFAGGNNVTFATWSTQNIVRAGSNGTVAGYYYSRGGSVNLYTSTGVSGDAILSPTFRVDSTGDVRIFNTTASTSSTTGALIVTGGIGVGTSGINGVRIHKGLANEANSIAIGTSSLTSTTTGNGNTAVGISTLQANTDGYENTAIGQTALRFNTSGYYNTAIGSDALRTNTTGINNLAVGRDAGRYITDGVTSNATGTNSVFIGNATRALADAQTNQIVIGTNAIGNGSNTVTIGNSSVTDNYFTGRTITNGGVFRSIVSGSTGLQAYDANRGYFIGMIQGSSDSLFVINYDSGYSQAKTRILQATKAGAATIPVSLKVGTLGGSVNGTLSVRGTGSGSGTYSFEAANSAGASIFLVRDDKRTQVFDGDFDVLNGNITSANTYSATVGGTNRDLFIDNTGLIGYVSSFRASKKNIAPLSNTDWLHKLSTVTFNYRVKDSTGKYTDSTYKEKEYGLVAEEVETVNPEMVFYDVDSTGKHLRGVHYSKLIIPLLKEIQDQKKRIDAQQTVIEALIKRIEILEKR